MRTAHVLRKMATVIATQGLHTGQQFAQHGPMDKLDICAVAYIVAEDKPAPDVFFTNEDVSLTIISASAPAMAAIRALSDALDSDANDTEIAPGYWVPDYIEHVTQWVLRPGIGCTEPPSVDEVIGRILRTAGHTPQPIPHAA